MRIFGKIMAVPGIGIVKMVGFIMNAIIKIASVLIAPFLIFVGGCSIYSAVIHNWRNLMILLVVAGICIVFCVMCGVLLGLLDIAGNRMIRFLRS